MPRPKRPRHIISRPAVRGFRPEGVDAAQEVVLSFEEFEAIRLIDYEGMDQSQVAQVMDVSRQTVGRILKLGRFKLVKTIVEAHRLKVDGGCYRLGGRQRGRRCQGQGNRGRGKGMGKQGRGVGQKKENI